MKQNNRRNLGIIAHVDAGKTTVTAGNAEHVAIEVMGSAHLQLLVVALVDLLQQVVFLRTGARNVVQKQIGDRLARNVQLRSLRFQLRALAAHVRQIRFVVGDEFLDRIQRLWYGGLSRRCPDGAGLLL